MKAMKSDIKELNKKELRQFGLITGAIVAVLFGLFLPWVFENDIPTWPWIITAVLWLWAIVLPATLAPVYRAWMAFGNVLGFINTRIILGIMFYLMFLPAGFIMRLLGKDPMARKIDKDLESYRTIHACPKRNHVERPY
ncbi:SxtJ family membrane protein [Solemya elarraichensis gill symbiont]|nr:SxtJ family membrane protein [Solemya elarraichensis gill symbiont]